MKPEDFGYNEKLKEFLIEHNPDGFEIGRVIAEHRERYIIITGNGEFDAGITGNMRFTAKNREDFPAVGDWVALTTYDDGIALIHKILPRISILKRQAVDRSGEIQVIAANIDYAFLVQAVDRDFNINRLERYLTICNSSKISPIIVLSKIDLKDEQQISLILEDINARIKNVPVIAISNISQDGYEALNAIIEKGKTYCLLGSSGVGKSTLVNNLSGTAGMRTDTISQSTNKGRHITSHRELFILENGGLLIDNPGMKEVGIADTGSGLEMTFDTVVTLALDCKFKDCTHSAEPGCAVQKAVKNGQLDMASYENYMKMEREKAHFEASLEERRRKEKEFGKIMKNYKKDINKNNR